MFCRIFPYAIHRYDVGERRGIHARISMEIIELTGSLVQDLSEPLVSHCAEGLRDEALSNVDIYQVLPKWLFIFKQLQNKQKYLVSWLRVWALESDRTRFKF